MPEVKPGEDKSSYMHRCVPVVMDEGKPQDQAVAICLSKYKGKNESITIGKIDMFLNEKSTMRKTNKGFVFKTKKDDSGHIHDLTVDDEGNGKTTSTNSIIKRSSVPNHVHKIFEFQIQPKNGHMHTIEE